ncbi:MAG TPA: DUF805 domain-containing protein [Fluviicoccus sp.]|nr:DUF805 domain-containing protein [Fluviicoccus sp.]
METNNPYQSTSAVAAQTAPSTYIPNVFSFSGRIGRLRYLAYTMAIMLVFIPLAMLGVILGEATSQIIGMTLMGVAMVGYIALFWAMIVRRLNDLGRTGWMSLLVAVPVINVLMWFYLLLVPGTDVENEYGPAPAPNGNFVVLGVLFMPLLMGVGLLNLPGLKRPQPAVAPETLTEQAAPVTTASEAMPKAEMAAPTAPEMAAPAEAPSAEAAPSAYAPSDSYDSGQQDETVPSEPGTEEN